MSNAFHEILTFISYGKIDVLSTLKYIVNCFYFMFIYPPDYIREIITFCMIFFLIQKKCFVSWVLHIPTHFTCSIYKNNESQAGIHSLSHDFDSSQFLYSNSTNMCLRIVIGRRIWITVFNRVKIDHSDKQKQKPIPLYLQTHHNICYTEL